MAIIYIFSPMPSPLLSVPEYYLYVFKRMCHVPVQDPYTCYSPSTWKGLLCFSHPLLASTLVQYIYSSVLSSKAASLDKPSFPPWGKDKFLYQEFMLLYFRTLFPDVSAINHTLIFVTLILSLSPILYCKAEEFRGHRWYLVSHCALRQ